MAECHRLVKCEVAAHEGQKVFLNFHLWGKILMQYSNIWRISFKNLNVEVLIQKARGTGKGAGQI